MHKKKLLIVTELYPNPENIYLGTFVVQQLSLLKENFDITVLTVFQKSLRLLNAQSSSYREEKGMKIFSIPYYPFWIQGLRVLKLPNSLQKYLNKIVTRRRLYRLAKKLHVIENFDLVHGHETYIGDEAGPIGKLLGIPSVFTLHSFYFYHKKIFGGLAVKLAVKNLLLCDQYISVSQIAANSYIQENLQRGKFSVIPNGILLPKNGDPDQKTLDFAKGRKVLLSVGYLSDEKRFDISIRALAKLSKQDVVLVIAGIGTEKKKLQNLAISLQVEERILWLDAVKPELMPGVFQASYILIHPSVVDSFSMVCLEAMSHGKVVICNTLIGICEFTTNDENIILVEPDNVYKIVEAISDLLSKSYRYNHIGEQAKQLAETMTWDQQTKKIGSVYKRLLITSTRADTYFSS